MLKSKLAIVAIAALCIASPALAQSFSSEAGSGNIVAATGGRTTAQTGQVAAHRSGLRAYGLVPRQAPTAPSIDPGAAYGGGSAGYNETNMKY
jgi:hypothetical protein